MIRPKANCPNCKRPFMVRADGRLGKHRDGRTGCEGSESPVDDYAERLAVVTKPTWADELRAELAAVRAEAEAFGRVAELVEQYLDEGWPPHDFLNAVHELVEKTRAEQGAPTGHEIHAPVGAAR